MAVFLPPTSLPIPSERAASNAMPLPVPPCSPGGVMDAWTWESNCCNQALALTAKHRLLHDTAQERTHLCLQQGKDISNCERKEKKNSRAGTSGAQTAVSFQVLKHVVGLWPTQ